MADFPDPAKQQLAPAERVSKLKSSLVMTATGVVLPQTLAEVAELAQYMCKAGSSIPVQMRDNPGECMGVIMDAMTWGMNPYAVARQCYVVESKEGNQTRAYMSQLITAVIEKFAPIKERVIAPTYIGEGPSRQCKISLHHAETGELMEYISPPIGPTLQGKADDGSRVKSPGHDYVGIWPKNSPLWRTEPDQQLWYYSIRAWARRFQPGIILGVYDIEEARQMVYEMRDVTPKEKKNLLEDPDDAPAHVHEGEVQSPQTQPMQREATDIAEVMEREAELVKEAWDTETGEIIDDGTLGMEAITEQDVRDLGDHARAVEERQQGLGLDVPADVTPEKMFANLAKGLEACQTVKDYEAWRGDNYTPDTRKAIGEQHWKNLGALISKTEDRVGYL